MEAWRSGRRRRKSLSADGGVDLGDTEKRCGSIHLFDPPSISASPGNSAGVRVLSSPTTRCPSPAAIGAISMHAASRAIHGIL